MVRFSPNGRVLIPDGQFIRIAVAFYQTSPERVVDEGERVASVLLAILFAHLIGATNISWAAFSGYAVMRGHVAESFFRGVLRIVGTIAGAALGLLITPLVETNILFAAIALSLIGGVTLYGAITGKRAYAWLFTGLTFVMILLDKMEHPALAIRGFAETRVLEVIAGTVACVVVSTVSTLTLRRRWPAERSAAAEAVGWHPHAARHAAQAATALAFLPPLGLTFHVPQLAQSAVTIMAVMLVPASGIGASGLIPVSRRLLHRTIGCLAGAVMAALFLFAGHGTPAILIAGTILGVAIGRHLENGEGSWAYVGTQFVFSVLIALVPDNYANAQIGPAENRLVGLLVGMALLEPILLLWHLVAPGKGAIAKVLGAEGGGD
jgi:uncharacterized membrane protein YccC